MLGALTCDYARSVDHLAQDAKMHASISSQQPELHLELHYQVQTDLGLHALMTGQQPQAPTAVPILQHHHTGLSASHGPQQHHSAVHLPQLDGRI